MKSFYDVCIVGGGASGIFSAILTAIGGKTVCILESKDRIGKKLLSTGNGRCNLSNANISTEFYNNKFVDFALKQFDFKNCLMYFNNLGLLTKIIDERLYPFSESASNVLNVFRANLEKYDVDVVCNCEVKKISKNKLFTIESDYGICTANAVIFATGSNATFGKNSHSMLQNLGHTCQTLRPSLCPMIVTDNSVKNLQGIRCNVNASLIVNDKVVHQERGEVLFKQNGLSGIVIFNLSSILAHLRVENAKVSLDFAPDYTMDELVLLTSNSILLNFGFLHKNIVANIQERGLKCVKDYVIKVAPCMDFSQAQVASGGLRTNEFNPQTMESMLISNLYATGEALNIDGQCGGYNLHWAWASGFLAANAILRK